MAGCRSPIECGVGCHGDSNLEQANTGTTPLAVQGQVQVGGEVKANVRSIETPVQVKAAVSVNETVNVNGKVNVGGTVTVEGNVGAKVKPTLLPLP